MIPRKFTERPPRGAGAAMFKAAFVTDPQHTVVSVRFELGKVALTTALSATVVGVVARTIPHSHPFFPWDWSLWSFLQAFSFLYDASRFF